MQQLKKVGDEVVCVFGLCIEHLAWVLVLIGVTVLSVFLGKRLSCHCACVYPDV